MKWPKRGRNASSSFFSRLLSLSALGKSIFLPFSNSGDGDGDDLRLPRPARSLRQRGSCEVRVSGARHQPTESLLQYLFLERSSIRGLSTQPSPKTSAAPGKQLAVVAAKSKTDGTAINLPSVRAALLRLSKIVQFAAAALVFFGRSSVSFRHPNHRQGGTKGDNKRKEGGMDWIAARRERAT